MTSPLTRSRAFIIPGELAGPSGGSKYNERMIRELGVCHVAIAGSWPRPSEADRAELSATLSRFDDVVVDGLIASAAPAELAATARVRVLMHLPLPADGGDFDHPSVAAREREALHRAETVVATSAWARDDLIRRYALPNVAVAPPGTDRAPLAAGSTPVRIMVLGSLTPRKNALELIAALSLIDSYAWSARIVGPAPPSAYAEAVGEAVRNTDGRIMLMPAQHGADLERLWHETDLLVVPSTAETYGMVVTEALAHGVPAIVSAGTGAVEALRGTPGESRAALPPAGAVIHPHDTHGWAAAIAEFSDDPDRRRAWRSAARAHRTRLPSWNTQAARLRSAIGW